MNFELVNKQDPILYKPTQRFNFTDSPFDPIEFSKEFIKFMYESKGIGLAANQVGIPYSVFAMRGDPENFVCFNPRIVQPSHEEIILEEGCLTYPGFYVKIKRPRHIRVRFNTPNGDVLTKQFTGMTARIFQHEYDHLQGTPFFLRASRVSLEMALKRAKKLGYTYTMKDLKGE